MLCGVLQLIIIDAFYGSPRHGNNTYWTVACGNPIGDAHAFVADFNSHNKYERCELHHDQSIKGYLHVKPPADIIKLQPQIVTLIPPPKETVNEVLKTKAMTLHGKAVLEYTQMSNDMTIDVTYTLEHTNTTHVITRVEFFVPTDKLKETYKILYHLGVCTLETV